MTPGLAEFMLERSRVFGNHFNAFAIEHGVDGVDLDNWPADTSAELDRQQRALVAEWRIKAERLFKEP